MAAPPTSIATSSTALAQVLVQHGPEDLVLGLRLAISARPEFQEAIEKLAAEEPLKRYAGSVSSFLSGKGFGFITSEEATAEYGRDTFVSDKELGNFKVGDVVAFTIVPNKDNKPQARLLEAAAGGEIDELLAVEAALTAPRKGSTANSAWWDAQAPPAKVRRTGPLPAGMTPPPPAILPAGVASVSGKMGPGETAYPGRHIGVISEFFPEKGYGFIQSESLKETFGRDVFLSNQEEPNPIIGQTVSFAVVVKGGRPQARQLQPMNGSVPSVPKAQMPSAPQLATTWTKPPVTEAQGGQRFSGIISAYTPAKNYGFIKCEETFNLYGKDVFLSSQEIGPFAVGSSVTFRVVENMLGKPQARDLEQGL
mmetsp:Transcript_35348/g.75335  ORF Transcript_35348/g.75335 Transcript_35348/m.75335 type:complete len:367 (-) Transcript_35348:40-1140(-)|eukprot:CAMPEP_0206581318 /NCGR_PEP_ID=MMETSP0325_2-20121206/33765_1 /ASSEMBLY_ACC=CAM_ASM_000347 /TAXON_ID=2866 /ORGANISM="Crypthecodinium cohnii, Strain Seligo" /LENGTH=366 /DNA_ID=CAMNT_0054087681 /DNA_START=110 /DNA_END=1210 /DNA_ORIENTATION=-